MQTSEPVLRPVSDTAADIDAHVFETDLVAVGAFRCRPSHPLFRDSGPIRNHCVVFPRSSSMIRPSGFQTFVGNPGAVSVYNSGQAYERQVLSPVGDHSDYFAVEDSTLRQVAAERHPRAVDRSDPFAVSHVPTEPRWYYRQRQIFGVCPKPGARTGHPTPWTSRSRC